ncbi:DUF4194 domain-containing protein [Saccharophagus degradans]|uniref:DUF4194 domain-containing protein n=1 Tax=Saccharophagus degradans TaxID=86304 RepID=A0AAW7X8A2_9GAMM|nr:DUF4194 domain-containing protein [Saccharophagus degradans]MDO6422786.1 DUF4194 domain-containing protein [Saccharophagus degradans]MDO6606259.1 DUF4194 domain-containing protein [Saccharophagus degradans]
MIDTFLEEQLKPAGLSREEFSEVVIRLLDYGVICRDESQIEASLYDRYLQCANTVEDYLAVIGVRIQHDRQFCFLRVFPPGANVPGMADEDSSPFNSGFRAKPNQQEVAAILVLRAEYEKSLREGQVDEKGRAMLSLEGLAIAMNNLLKRALPDGLVERKNLFRRLRQLRLVHFNTEDELDNSESWLSIQPSITSFVSDEVLSTLLEQSDASVPVNKPAINDASKNEANAIEVEADKEIEEENKIIPSALFGSSDADSSTSADEVEEDTAQEEPEQVDEQEAPPVVEAKATKAETVKKKAAEATATKATTSKQKAPAKKAAPKPAAKKAVAAKTTAKPAAKATPAKKTTAAKPAAKPASKQAATTKKPVAKKPAAKPAAAKAAPVKKATTAKSAVKKAPAKPAATKATATKTTAKKAPAKTPAKKSPARKAPAKPKGGKA